MGESVAEVLDVAEDVGGVEVFDDVKADKCADGLDYDYGKNGYDEADNGIADGADGLFDFAFFASGKDEGETADNDENYGEYSGEDNGIS